MLLPKSMKKLLKKPHKLLSNQSIMKNQLLPLKNQHKFQIKHSIDQDTSENSKKLLRTLISQMITAKIIQPST
jgi:hypothetical protein